MPKRKNKGLFHRRLNIFILGFIIGLLPAIVELVLMKPFPVSFAFLPIIIGLVAGLVALAINWLWSKNKIAGIVSLIIIGLLYLWISIAFLSVSFTGLY